MSDEILDGLNTIENDIFEFGSVFGILLEMIRKKLNKDNANTCSNEDCEIKLEEMITILSKIKDDLHKSTGKIYKENDFRYMSKNMNDVHELKNLINFVDNKFKNFSI